MFLYILAESFLDSACWEKEIFIAQNNKKNKSGIDLRNIYYLFSYLLEFCSSVNVSNNGVRIPSKCSKAILFTLIIYFERITGKLCVKITKYNACPF